MKFIGKIGYATQIETSPDVWKEQYIECSYKGDMLSLNHRLQNGTEINDTPRINMRVSVVCDAYGRDHYNDIRYVVHRGLKLKVESVELKYPRLELGIGGTYNEEPS